MKPTVIGITGGSGSGKTLFINRLVEYLAGDVAVHTMDNYYIPRHEQPIDDQGVQNFDTLQSIDHLAYLKDLDKLIAGKSIQLKEYVFNNPDKEPDIITVEPAPIIITEGIFTLYHEEIRERLDLKLFIEAPDFLMLKRRIIRDAKERGYDLEDVLYRYHHHVIPAFERHIIPSKKWADLIVPNHANFDVALGVIGAYAKSVI